MLLGGCANCGKKTESAVRLTHVLTGLSVIAKDERSQHLNQKLAYARLYQVLRSYDKTLRKKQERENRTGIAAFILMRIQL